MEFFSQVGQDRFLFQHFFYGRRGGVFVDIGAYDGVKFSNTLFFERTMDWRGLCVEPLPAAFAKLSAARTAICENCAVGDIEGEAEFIEAEAGPDEKMLSGLSGSFDPRHVERLRRVATATSKRTVPVTRLPTLLERHQLWHIDYCSIDTEGSELAILSQLDFAKFDISVFTIENNYDDERLPRFMHDKGYDFVDKLEQDYVFKKRGIAVRPQTTVICAVWHKDPQRLEKLAAHQANLAKQTVPVEPVYVFDGGDVAPDWVQGRVISVKEPLTIYQAWNLALAVVNTPFIMNLNLDDRLAVDAVERLQRALSGTKALLAGGDWRICYTAEETDAVGRCTPAEEVPFVDTWPPPAGTVTRLGSGTGARNTRGPATLWRIEVHRGIPRYPWRFEDGTPIQIIADAVWWGMMANHFKLEMIRLPLIIGHYHSRPAEQAEFRRLPYDEHDLLAKLRVELL